MTRPHRSIRLLLVGALGIILAAGTSLAVPDRAAAAPGAKKKKEPAGPAKSMKATRFVTLRSVSILYIQFYDKKKNPTKAPAGGRITWSSNVTKPRKGKADMSEAKWKESQEAYVFVKLPIRQKWVCPPRNYWIRVTFFVGKKRRFTSILRQKFPCLR
jgi:hypothetical protein